MMPVFLLYWMIKNSVEFSVSEYVYAFFEWMRLCLTVVVQVLKF